MLRHMMRMHRTGVFAPKIQTTQTTTHGRAMSIDTSLNKVKNVIATNFRQRQQSLFTHKKQPSLGDTTQTRQRQAQSMMQDVPARVDHKRPKEKFDGLQTYDFGIPENDYSWKTSGAQRLLYNLMEKDRFERMKVN